MSKRMWFYSSLFVLIFAADRITKWLVVHFLKTSYHINSFLEITKTINRGISWGFFHSAPEYGYWFITVLIAVFCGALIYYAYARLKEKKSILGEVLIIAGGVSNLIDRVLYNGVIDFILISIGEWSWPVFNIADIAIVLGATCMLFESFGGWRDE